MEAEQVKQISASEEASKAIRKKGPRLFTVLFPISIILIVGTLLAASWYLYVRAGKSSADLYGKAAELALQLAFVILIGALITAYINWGITRRREKREKQMDFMRRVRSMHVTVEYARTLLNAHRSPKTYSEQLRRLMELRTEVEEISEDLTASPRLFAYQDQIIVGLGGIIEYLKVAGAEYVRGHGPVAAGYNKETLDQTIENEELVWVDDFMKGGEEYKKEYDKNLTAAKGSMRLEIYGQLKEAPTPPSHSLPSKTE